MQHTTLKTENTNSTKTYKITFLHFYNTKYHRQQPLYNTLELLIMGIVVPETCWASNKICNKNLCCISLAFYFHILTIMHGQNHIKFVKFLVVGTDKQLDWVIYIQQIVHCLLCIICSNADTLKMTCFIHLRFLLKNGNIFLGNSTDSSLSKTEANCDYYDITKIQKFM